MDLNEISQLIETSLTGLKLNPAETRGEKPGQWSYKVKDATVWVDAYDLTASPGVYYVQVMSPLCSLPDKKTSEFLQDLLEINHKMYNAAMCKKDGWIYVLIRRPAEGLGAAEIDNMLDQVAFYSTDYYSKLSFKYEGCWTPKTTTDTTTGSSEPGPVQ